MPESTTGRDCAISPLTWILIAAVAWMCLAVVVGLVVGRVIRNRDRQVPKDNDPPPRQKSVREQEPGAEKPTTPRGG